MPSSIRFMVISSITLASSVAYARSLEEIRKSGELRICHVLVPDVVEASPAACKPADCKFSGPAYEFAQAFAKHLGVKATYPALLDWDEQFQNAQGKTVRDTEYEPKIFSSGKCDVLPNNLTKNAWRQKIMEIVVLFPSRTMVVVNKARKAEFKGVEDLGGKAYAGIENTAFHTMAMDLNKTSHKEKPIRFEFMPIEEAMQKLDANKADFMAMDADVALSATQHKMKNSVVGFPVGGKDELGWGVSRKDASLRDSIQAFFAAEQKNAGSSLSSIWKKYYGMGFSDFAAVVSQVK